MSLIGGEHGSNQHGGEKLAWWPMPQFEKLKEYLKKEDSLVEENYDLLGEADFFEQL